MSHTGHSAKTIFKHIVFKTLREKPTLVAAIFFIFFAIIFTYPFIRHPFTTLVAPPAGDVANSVTKYEALKREGKNPFVDTRLDSINAPEGIQLTPAVDRVSFLYVFFIWMTTLIFNSLFAHGILTFAGYFLSSFSLYLFVKKITRSERVSLLSGFLICIFPLFLGLARAAPAYIHMWMYVLPIWAFLNLARNESRKNFLIAGLSIVPALFWTPYFTQHILLIGASCWMVALLQKHTDCFTLRRIGNYFFIGVFWIALCILFIALGMSTDQGGAPVRTLQEAYEQSAHPLMYVMPGIFSWWGHSLYDVLINLVPRASGTTLYLGVSVLLLTIAAVIARFKLLRAISLPDASYKLPITLSVTVLVCCFLFSLAPTIDVFGISIPTPNYIVVSLVPALRAGQRLASPMMIGTIIMAAIGIMSLLKLIPRRHSLAVFLVICAVITIDLSSRPMIMTNHIVPSAAIRVLASQPRGLTAQYVHSSIGDPGQIACQMQLLHKQPIINDCGIKPSNQPHHVSNILSIIGDAPSMCDQRLILMQNNVQYVILAKTEWDKVVSCYSQDKVISSDEWFTVYRI